MLKIIIIKNKNKISIERDMARGEKRERECILKAQVPDVSMRPPPLCTDADDLLRCSATVGNLGERGARHPYFGKALGTFACTKDRAKHTGPPF